LQALRDLESSGQFTVAIAQKCAVQTKTGERHMLGKKRVVLVTGGMGGLGEAICKKMAAMGNVVATTYSPSNTTSGDWLKAMKAEGFTFHAYPVDVTSFEACAALIPKVQADLGPVDVLVNNAGITRDTTFKKMSKVDWDAVMHTNLDSTFNMTKPVMDGMVDRGWGRVINISSVNGQKGAFGQTNYSAAKAGMHGFTKALALEVARRGVTVNTISPGYIGTKMVMAIDKSVLDTKIIPQIPMGRLGKPDEVAGLVAYLASDEAAFLTGANIAINGGQHMQ
jgi:acetoacetyl-CoA reductase